MPTVQAEVQINGLPGPIFDLAQDYTLRLLWDPFLREMKFLNDARAATDGVRVWVRAWTGLTMEVEYVAVNRPTSVAMRMTRGPWFFETFAGSWRFEPSETGSTRVIFRYTFRTRPRSLAPLLDRLISSVFERDLRARLMGLKRGVEQNGLLERLPQPPTEAR